MWFSVNNSQKKLEEVNIFVVIQRVIGNKAYLKNILGKERSGTQWLPLKGVSQRYISEIWHIQKIITLRSLYSDANESKNPLNLADFAMYASLRRC